MHFPHYLTSPTRSTQAAIIIFVLALVIKLSPTPIKAYKDYVLTSSGSGIQMSSKLNMTKQSMAECVLQPNFIQLECEKSLKPLGRFLKE